MRRRTSKILAIAQYVFLLAGVGALGYYAVSTIGAHSFQAREAQKFDAEVQAIAPAAASVKISPAAHRQVKTPPRRAISRPPLRVKQGEVLGRLEIPRIGLWVMVVEGVDNHDLKQAAGHIPGTALPWQNGNVGIAAHRDTYFRPLEGLRENDTIQLRTLDGSYRYRVVSMTVVQPDDVQVLRPTKRTP